MWLTCAEAYEITKSLKQTTRNKQMTKPKFTFFWTDESPRFPHQDERAKTAQLLRSFRGDSTNNYKLERKGLHHYEVYVRSAGIRAVMKLI